MSQVLCARLNTLNCFRNLEHLRHKRELVQCACSSSVARIRPCSSTSTRSPARSFTALLPIVLLTSTVILSHIRYDSEVSNYGNNNSALRPAHFFSKTAPNPNIGNSSRHCAYSRSALRPRLDHFADRLNYFHHRGEREIAQETLKSILGPPEVQISDGTLKPVARVHSRLIWINLPRMQDP